MNLHLVGGFLGSGKTTAILQATRFLTDEGQRVGIITNEQGKHLVDTAFFQSQALPVAQVTGGCICCHLDDFSQRVDDLVRDFDPQVIFAESVGSCTDLVATVLKPLLRLREHVNTPASLTVFSDARLLRRFLNGEEMPFSDGIIYIFEKQIEEAELVIINKADLLSEMDRQKLSRMAEERYSDKQFRLQNSLDPNQARAWLNILEGNQPPRPTVSLDLDYDAYALGEGRFCWVDRHLRLTAQSAHALSFLGECILEICRQLKSLPINIAHLKFLINARESTVRFNLTALEDIEERIDSLRIDLETLKPGDVELRINSMVEGDLSMVEKKIDTIILDTLSQTGLRYSLQGGFTCVPGYPRPTQRIAND